TPAPPPCRASWCRDARDTGDANGCIPVVGDPAGGVLATGAACAAAVPAGLVAVAAVPPARHRGGRRVRVHPRTDLPAGACAGREAAVTPSADPRCAEVLAFWFGSGSDDAEVLAERGARWFARDAGFDEDIRRRFAGLRAEAVAGALSGWLGDPHGRLALVLLVDQFARNLLRGDARAFGADSLALAWSREAVDLGIDRALRPIERVFLFLPFEHAESLPEQDRPVALFSELHDEVPQALRAAFAQFLDYARRHRDIIVRFGRFPHRNEVLGRASSAAEVAFLAQPGSSF